MTLPTGVPTKAVFEVKFSDAKESRTVTKYAPSRDRYEPDDDRSAIESFFSKNGFYLNAGKTSGRSRLIIYGAPIARCGPGDQGTPGTRLRTCGSSFRAGEKRLATPACFPERTWMSAPHY
jgi:hypothetical protein